MIFSNVRFANSAYYADLYLVDLFHPAQFLSTDAMHEDVETNPLPEGIQA